MMILVLLLSFGLLITDTARAGEEYAPPGLEAGLWTSSLPADLRLSGFRAPSAAFSQSGSLDLEDHSSRSSRELLPALQLSERPEAYQVLSESEAFAERLSNARIGLGPLLMLAPDHRLKPEKEEPGDSKIPALALLVRAKGRALVTVAGTSTDATSGDDLILHRSIVSDLFKSQRYSLSVYEDHVLGDRALRFLGIGTRLRAKPGVELFGRKLRFDFYGSYHPSHGAAGYFTVSTNLGRSGLDHLPRVEKHAAKMAGKTGPKSHRDR